MNFINNILNWQFMNESAKRWFLFFGLLIAINVIWAMVFGVIRKAAS